MLRRILAFFILALAVGGGFLRAEEPGELRFLSYNLKNYIRMERTVPGRGKVLDAPKPETEIDALISIIVAERPDVIGICEIGDPSEFADFLRRLKAAGCDLPYSEYVRGSDPERHLALASRFPIAERHSESELPFDLDGRKEYFKRGILDASVEVSPGNRIRFVGTHLKSQREDSNDQSLLRRREAHLFRSHLLKIFEGSSAGKMLVYGDLNDTIDQPPIREIIGRKGTPDYLAPLNLSDANGEKWTHYWDLDDTYSRIDYVFASVDLLKDVVASRSHLSNPVNWMKASDHRPLLVVLRMAPAASD